MDQGEIYTAPAISTSGGGVRMRPNGRAVGAPGRPGPGLPGLTRFRVPLETRTRPNMDWTWVKPPLFVIETSTGGGLIFQGTGANQAAYSQVSTGVLVFAGQGSDSLANTYYYEGIGGFILAGAGDYMVTLEPVAGEGGLIFGGSVDDSLQSDYGDIGIGKLKFAGSGTPGMGYLMQASGKISLRPISVKPSSGFNLTDTGGVHFAGAGAVAKAIAPAFGSGGFELAGTGTPTVGYHYAGAGGIDFAGAGDSRLAIFKTDVGGFKLRGVTKVSHGHKLYASGHLTFKGAGTDKFKQQLIGSGGFNLSSLPEPWTPEKNLALVEVWYDAYNTPSGQIDRWPDISGNGFDATQTDNAKRPSKAAGMVRFDNILDGMITSCYIAKPYTIFVVEKPKAIGRRTLQSVENDCILSSSRDTGENAYVEGSISHDQTIGPALLVLTAPDAGDMTYHVNGTDKTTGAVASRDWGTLAMGAAGLNNIEAAGTDVCEILVLKISSDVIIQGYPVRIHGEGYLAWKWDMVDRLPADHPYKTVQPMNPAEGGQVTHHMKEYGKGEVNFVGTGDSLKESIIIGQGKLVFGGYGESIIGDFPDKFCAIVTVVTGGLDIELCPHSAATEIVAAELELTTMEC